MTQQLINIGLNNNDGTGDTLRVMGSKTNDNFTELYSDKLTKGTKSIFCIDNGDYTTLQDAINAASAGTVIFVGPKTGGWGSITLKSGVDLMGLGVINNTFIQVGPITYSPSTGTSVTNRINLSNLYILGGLSVTGSVVARIRIDGCYISTDSGTTPTISWVNNYTNSALLINDSIIISSVSNTLLSFAGQYSKIFNTEFNGNTNVIMAVNQSSGNLTLQNCSIGLFYTGPSVTVSGTGTIFNSFGTYISNTGTNSSGISIGTNSAATLGGSTLFNISTGTGNSVNGTGYLYYDNTTNWTPTTNTTIGSNVIQVYTSPTTVAGLKITDAGKKYTRTFTNANLSAGVLTVTHNLNSQFVQVTIYNNSNQQVPAQSITATNANSTSINLSNLGTLTGTYNLIVIG